MKHLTSFFETTVRSFYSAHIYHEAASNWTTIRASIFILIWLCISEIVFQLIHFLQMIGSAKYYGMLILISIMMTIFMSLYRYIFILLASLIFCFIGISIGKFLSVNMRFQSYFRIAQLAFIPSIILELLRYLISFMYPILKNNSSLYFYLFYGIAFCYFIYASRSSSR